MDEMIQAFFRLLEIIESKNNCEWHYAPLKKLIQNFNFVYAFKDDSQMRKEANVLTSSLFLKLQEVYYKNNDKKFN